MLLQTFRRVELLFALVAGETPLIQVDQLVADQMIPEPKLFVAKPAAELQLIVMHPHVVVQGDVRLEALITHGAAEVSFPRVQIGNVVVQQSLVAELFLTECAIELFDV